MEPGRVFIGLPAGKQLSGAALRFRHAHGDLQVRWMAPENLHVTLVPPWALVDPEQACRLLERFASRARAVPVRFDSVSAGPDPRRPRLLWATGKAPDCLGRLSAELNEAFGNGRESCRAYLLHLTIARFSRQQPVASAIPELQEAVAWEGLLDTLALYQSILMPQGAVYRMLCRYRLSGSFEK